VKAEVDEGDVAKIKLNQRADLEAQADNLGVRETVLFLGNRSDTDVIYAGLDLVALTSFNEGTPLSLIEAMANGKPFVSTKVGGVVDLMGAVEEEKENFTVGERGIGTASGDASALADALVFLAADAPLRDAFGARGREFVRRQYSQERLTEDIKNLYRELIQN